MTFLRAFLDDLVKLKLPVTAAAVLATVLALAAPFGLTIDNDTAAVLTGALAAVGFIAAYVQSKLGGVKVETNPATLPPYVLTADGIIRHADVTTGPLPGHGDPATPRAPGDAPALDVSAAPYGDNPDGTPRTSPRGDDPLAGRERLPS